MINFSGLFLNTHNHRISTMIFFFINFRCYWLVAWVVWNVVIDTKPDNTCLDNLPGWGKYKKKNMLRILVINTAFAWKKGKYNVKARQARLQKCLPCDSINRHQVEIKKTNWILANLKFTKELSQDHVFLLSYIPCYFKRGAGTYGNCMYTAFKKIIFSNV